MSVVPECLSKISLGAPQIYKNLTLFPLVSDARFEPNYLLLDEALAQGCARVTEVSDSRSVPELKFVNDSDRSVLLLDGEELVGAKQNRILNLSVLAPAHKTIEIPVSCVEAGRWHAQSDEFVSAKRAHFTEGRARKAVSVSNSLHSMGSRCSDQYEVWADISEKAARMDVISDTDAADALYTTHRESLDEYTKAFSANDHQTGALFVINRKVVGLDLFDSAATLSSLFPKLVQSVALDAIDAGGSEVQVDKTIAQKLIDDTAKAAAEHFPAVGEGDDLRLRGEHIAGGALLVDDRIVHLCVFQLLEESNDLPGQSESRIMRASLRQRRRQ